MKNAKIYFLITLFFSVLALIVFWALELFLEPRISNFYTKQWIKDKAPDDVVMIIIDQKSVDRIRWPWKRKLYANIIEYLNDYGHASVIVHDSLIYSPDTDFPESDTYFFKTIKKYDNYISAFDAGYNTPRENKMSESDLNILNSKSALNIKYQIPQSKSALNSVLKLHPMQLKNASGFGSVVTPIDKDGYVRSAFPVLRIGDKSYPMLAFAAAAKHKGINSFYVTDKFLCSDDGCKTFKIRVNNTIYGLQMFIKWYIPIDSISSHKTYSAIDVLDSLDLVKQGKKPIINPEIFKDKIVIVGAAANVKSLEDIKSTPVIDKTHAGADIQATIINNILTNDVRYEINFFTKLFIALSIVLISLIIISTFSLTPSLITLAILMIGYFITAKTLFMNGVTIQLITPIFLVLMVISAGFTFRFLLEGKKKEQIQNAMGLYISKDIMKSVVKNIDNIKLGGKKANITVLFADIRGFTSISERLSAEEVTTILNEYFTAVEPIIRKYNGVLNKFIGDAVMAIFGEPIQDRFHSKNAVLCARDMHRAIEDLQLKWELEGKPHIEIGIAINTGEAFVGNIGSPERIEYTVIGDTVNTASRIESYNKVYKTRFLISESTYEKVSQICDVIKIREVAIRGKAKKINIYEVLRVSEGKDGAGQGNT